MNGRHSWLFNLFSGISFLEVQDAAWGVGIPLLLRGLQKVTWEQDRYACPLLVSHMVGHELVDTVEAPELQEIPRGLHTALPRAWWSQWGPGISSPPRQKTGEMDITAARSASARCSQVQWLLPCLLVLVFLMVGF